MVLYLLYFIYFGLYVINEPQTLINFSLFSVIDNLGGCCHVTPIAKYTYGGRDFKPRKVTIFFFSHFFNNYGERDMLKIF